MKRHIYGSARRIATGLVIVGAAWSTTVALSLAEGVAPSKPNFSGSFPKKATERGEPLSRPINTLKLNAEREVSVKISSKKGCFFGDLDLMLVEMSWSKFYDLRVSLEPLDDSKEAPSSELMNVKDLSRGSHTVALKVPKVLQPTLMGLYICRDSKKTGSCRAKPVVSPGDLIKLYSPESTAGKNEAGIAVDDKTYYFNHLVVEPEGVSTSKAVFDKAEFARISKIAKQESPNSFEKKLAKVYETQRTLSSAPLKQVDGALAVTLPISDFGNCSK